MNRNLAKLKEVLKKLKNKDSGIWTPSKNEECIRILPPIEEDDLFYEEIERHKIGGKYYNCLRYDNQKCPVCNKLEIICDKANYADIVKALNPYTSYLMYIVPRNGDEEVRIFYCCPSLFKIITNYMLSNNIDVTDADNGHDLILVRINKNGIVDYSKSHFKSESTPIFENKDKIHQALEDRSVLKYFSSFSDYSKLEKIVDNYISHQE